MAVDRLNRKQVACKIVKLKTSVSDHIFSRHFENDGRYCISWTEQDTQMRSYGDMLRREVDMLKALSHVRARNTLGSLNRADQNPAQHHPASESFLLQRIIASLSVLVLFGTN